MQALGNKISNETSKIKEKRLVLDVRDLDATTGTEDLMEALQ